MRRIERLINLVAALLEARRPMTAEEIRERIAGYDQANHEAFRRAFERDKEALRDMGVPLELRKVDPFAEQTDGYIIPKERYYLPELDLEADELTALRLAAETILGRGEQEAEAGLLKLSMEDHPMAWPGPQVTTGTDVAVEDPVLGDVYAALLDKRPVEFSYEDARGRRSTRRLETWGLVHRAGHWYAVGRDVDAGERRTFKLSRIRDRVRSAEGSYEIPEASDVSASVGAEAWEFGPDEPRAVTVRFEPSSRWWAEQNLARLTVREAPAGALDVDLPTGNIAALLGWIVGWHGMVSIVAPAAVRERLVEHLSPWLENAS